jgi:hypothetical protein
VSSDTNQKERGAERKAHQGTEMLRLLRECQAKEMPRNAEKKNDMSRNKIFRKQMQKKITRKS